MSSVSMSTTSMLPFCPLQLLLLHLLKFLQFKGRVRQNANWINTPKHARKQRSDTTSIYACYSLVCVCVCVSTFTLHTNCNNWETNTTEIARNKTLFCCVLKRARFSRVFASIATNILYNCFKSINVKQYNKCSFLSRTSGNVKSRLYLILRHVFDSII